MVCEWGSREPLGRLSFRQVVIWRINVPNNPGLTRRPKLNTLHKNLRLKTHDRGLFLLHLHRNALSWLERLFESDCTGTLGALGLSVWLSELSRTPSTPKPPTILVCLCC